MGFDFSRFEVLTFDCYGTLIDWERGLLDSIRTVLDRRDIQAGDEELLEAYAREESRLEKGEYLPYREILRRCLQALGAAFGFAPDDDEGDAFANSVGDWPPFEDSSDALARLSTRFRLGVITNCDDDLFARSNEKLGVAFDWVVTAQQAGSYKPSERNFELALERIGVPRERVLHVAQSLYHDHAPAKRMGLSTVWVDRRQGKEGSGATPPASVTPDVTVPDMRSLADMAFRGLTSERELLAAEDAGWFELHRLVDSLRPEEAERPGYYAEGWSAKDAVAHIGSWLAVAGAVLQQIREGTYRPERIDIDELNQRFRENLKDVPFDTIRSQATTARARMLQAWSELGELTSDASFWIRKAGAEHYGEHLPRLRQWIGDLQSG